MQNLNAVSPLSLMGGSSAPRMGVMFPEAAGIGPNLPPAAPGPEKKMAVSVGFEPTESFPSRAFEARSFGRSDTTPRERLPVASGNEEIGQHLRTLICEHPCDDFWPMWHARVADNIPQ